MTIKQTLEAIVLAGAIGLTGCKREYKTGTIEKEYGTVTQIVESSGALFGNESVKFSDSTYILQIKTTEGIYTASILPAQYGIRPIEALATAFKEGDRVKFVVHDPMLQYGEAFGSDRVGKIYSDQIIKIWPKE